MTAPAALAQDPATESAGPTAQHAPDDMKTFVAAIAVALRESVVGFEEAVSRVTEITAMRPGRADRELVVALQDFDRLQQEFATLGEVLRRISSGAPEAGKQISGGAGHPLLDGISMAGLKARLSFHLRSLTSELPDSDDGSDEVEF